LNIINFSENVYDAIETLTIKSLKIKKMELNKYIQKSVLAFIIVSKIAQSTRFCQPFTTNSLCYLV